MSTWYNPLGMSDMTIPDEELLTSWRNAPISEYTYREMVRMAWDISPALAVALPTRYGSQMTSMHNQTHKCRVISENYLSLLNHLLVNITTFCETANAHKPIVLYEILLSFPFLTSAATSSVSQESIQAVFYIILLLLKNQHPTHFDFIHENF